MNAKAQRIYIDKFHEWVVGTAHRAAKATNRPNTKRHHFIYIWFWPHGIWLRCKSQNETTSADCQENRGLDLVVPQRINALCVPFHFHILFLSFFSIPEWSFNTWSVYSVAVDVDICTFISIKRQTLVRNIRYLKHLSCTPLMQTKNNWRRKTVRISNGYQFESIHTIHTYMDYNNQINSNAQPAQSHIPYKTNMDETRPFVPPHSTNANTMKNWRTTTTKRTTEREKKS